MQCGRWYKFRPEGDQFASTMEECQTIFCRAMILEEQTGDFIVEGLLRSLPFPFEDAEWWAIPCGRCTMLFICLCFDRAATNYVVAEYMLIVLVSLVLPLGNAALHSEPCWLHGTQLCKATLASTKSLVARAHSLTAFMKFWKKQCGGLRWSGRRR